MFYRSDLVSKLDVNSLQVQQRIAALKLILLEKGMTPDQALASAYKILDFSVMKQSYGAFLYGCFPVFGNYVSCCIPFLFYSLKKKGGRTIDQVKPCTKI